MSETAAKKKRSCHHLTPLQKYDLIAALKDPKTQPEIDNGQYHLTQYARILTERLKVEITRGNLYKIAHDLGLKFHHPLTGIPPASRVKAGGKTVFVRLAEAEATIAYLKSAVEQLQQRLGFLEKELDVTPQTSA